MVLHQNKSETAESIKEAKAVCEIAIKEAKATCACSIWEAETLCSMAIRDAETQGASQASSLHLLHAKSIQQLEKQAIEEENKSQLKFLSACQTTLQASPAELHGMLVASYQVLMGQVPMSLLFTLSKKPPPPGKGQPP